MTVLDEIVQDQLRTDLPELASGDTVKVSAKVVEGNRERIQVFEGTVMRLRGGGITRSITVRRIASAASASSGRSRSTARGSRRSRSSATAQVRRAQLYFLRDRVGKAATPPRAAHRRLSRRHASGPAKPLRPSGPSGRGRSRVQSRIRGRLSDSMAPIVPTLRHERRLWNEGLEPRRRASTRSASRRPAARSSRRP